MTTHARVVVIGGGVVGCSALYHLACLGWRDLLLLERDELTAGSTWHAAGNCPNFATTWSLLKLQQYSTALYARLPREVGYDINYHVTGSLRLAHGEDRVDEFRHIRSQARSLGLAFELLSPEEAAECHPLLNTDGIKAALWDPGDGDIDPAQLTQAFAKGARDRGARIERRARVRAITRRGMYWLLETGAGRITAEYVINAAGYRGAEVAALIGQFLPMVTLSHQYLVTEDLAALQERAPERLPLLRDPDESYYLRQERHGLLLGPYEATPRAHWLDGIPPDFAHQLFPDDLGRLERELAAAFARVPALQEAGVRRVINGPIPYAPDGNPLLGPAARARNFFHCCAFTFGIVQAGGAGKAIAEWVVHGQPDWDTWPLDPRRYHDYANRRYVLAKALETYHYEYAVSYPQEERPAGRPAKSSPLYARLAGKGARFGARGGWERAVYFAESAAAPIAGSFRRPPWHAQLGRECRAVMSGAGILDLTGLTRFELTGRAAAAWLDSLIAGPVPGEGRIGLAYFCTDAGGIATEMTVAHLAPGRFWLMGAAAAECHDDDWLHGRWPPAGTDLGLANLTADLGVLALVGPQAREILARVAREDFGNGSFPWLTVRSIVIDGAKITALRVNYVGELGWELHVPMPHLPMVYDRLCEAGAAAGIADFGLYALDSLRLEKCYRAWRSELTPDYSPLAASLGRFVRLDKPVEFVGRDALRREAVAGPRQRLVPLIVDAADADATPVSIVFHGDQPAGLVTSGGYGHRLQLSIALAYVRADLAAAGVELGVDILGERRRAVVAREPLYDPDNRRLRS